MGKGSLKDDSDVCAYLLEHGVALPNGASYGLSPYFRVSFASSLANLEEACKRMDAAARQLS
jgi:aspartate aminotransferase